VRSLRLLGALVLACAGVAGPSARPYRVFGTAATAARLKGQNVSESYPVELGEGVEYVAEAVEVFGTVRLRTEVRNRSREPARYDLQRIVVFAADGGLLRLVGTDENPSSAQAGAEHVPQDYLRGIRIVTPGQRLEVTRRLVLADGARQGRDPLLLSRLSLEDSVRVGVRDAGVALRLIQVR